ncbi:hypothetical protein [Allofrancisella frigidaquae]|uniref:Uncharacterized protein n=1 Tax=Allofrancisella frigidaquae TaxID=1085644 RepID=A0A6M3HUG3_9GAMM|nr:hypothetical protein [Allofrancisella frigidaquae]QIV94878.1 hypothetical protein E3E15_05760 [Allofrancisella frigidaquae]
MIDSDELLAIGAALVQTVRKYIKYSENIELLYSNYKASKFYKKRREEVIQIDNIPGLTYTPQGYGKVGLELGVGWCDELSLACLYIAQGSKKIRIGTFYLSLISTFKHTFVLAHTSLKLFNSTSPDWVYYKDNVHGLSIDPELSNAVIIDPWTYKATKLSNYLEHLEHAELFQVRDFFEGTIRYGGVRITISPESEVTNISEDYVNTFEFFYKEQQQKLLERSDSFARGRKFSSVENSLILDVNKENENEIVTIQRMYRGYATRKHLQQQLISLIDFFTRLKSKSSYWYSWCLHSDRKGKAINSVILYLERCIDDYRYPGEDKLVKIFIRVMTILPIVRSSNIAPTNLSKENITMTSTAKGLFSLGVVPETKYDFEKYTSDVDLKLDWVRDIRRHRAMDRVRYTALLDKLEGWNAQFRLEKLYTNKDGYYNLVSKAIDS